LTVSHQGFRKTTRIVNVTLGPPGTMNVSLEIETSSAAIAVTAEASLLQAENGDVSTTINQKQISEVPNPGNDLTYIAQISPGAIMNTDTIGLSYLGNVSILGMPGTSNLFTVNGMNNNSTQQNTNNSGALGMMLGQNQVQEATVVSNGYSAQFSGAAGANINYITKSGGNAFHGNASYYWNGRALNANDWIDNAEGNPRPFDIANQWAGSLGGPIIKNKLFFFFDTEGMHLVLPSPTYVVLPSPLFEAAAMENIDSVFGPTSASHRFYEQIFDLYNATPGASAAIAGNFSDSLGCNGWTDPNDPSGLGVNDACARRFFENLYHPASESIVSGRVDGNVGAADRVFLLVQYDHGQRAAYLDPISSAFNAYTNVPWWESQLSETHAMGAAAANQFLLGGTYINQVTSVANPAETQSVFPTTLTWGNAGFAFSNLGGMNLDAAGNMYGTTSQGGTSNWGTVFKLDSAGTESVLYSFTGAPDGAGPAGDLVLDAAGDLLGTTSTGGIAGAGTVFRLDPTGKQSVLYSFTGGADGAQPMAGLILDEKGNIYGTTIAGGVVGSCSPTKRDRSTSPVACGVVFELDTTGIESVLHSFTGEPDGAGAAGDLVRDASGNMYGTTSAGGTICYIIAPPLPGQGPSTDFYCGTVFKLDPTGNETLLHSFNGTPDGAIPHGGLILDAAGNVCATTTQGGAGACTISSGIVGSESVGCGSVFAVAATGSATVLYSFTGTGLDWAPKASLAPDPSGNLFGTTTQGGVVGGECGDFGCGVVFKLTANVNLPGAAAPTFSPPGGSYHSVQAVTISEATVNSAIYYTTDGSTPTTSSTRYSGALAVNVSETIQAIAAAPDFSNSSVVSADYTISTPDFSLTPAASNVTLASGGQATDVITIAPQDGAFANPIQLTCGIAGPSPTPTCSLSTASVTLGAKAATATLTITAPTAAAQISSPSQQVRPSSLAYAVWLPLAFVLAAAGGSKKRVRGSWAAGASLLLLLVLQSACGGGTTTGQTTYAVTVTAASGAIQHTTQVGVTLQ
jgi:uncharacterized repeat protein (TIGR03803 family)